MPKIRVLVVDDAVVMRKLITEALGQDPEMEVAGTAPHGKIALQKIPQINPDLLTLDVEMPEMDGLATLREVRRSYPKLPVIMFSTVTQRGAAITLEALAQGANDYVTKPANVGSVTESLQRLSLELIPKIKLHCRRLVAPLQPPAARQPAPRLSPRPSPSPATGTPVKIVCLGCSTGGPNALADVFAAFPGPLPVPMVMVQHMPPMFTAMLAERLTARSALPVREGRDGQILQPGHAYLAPGGRHMEIQRRQEQVVLRLHDGPPVNSCRPAVDVLFRSVVAVYGGSVLGVILTGMGQDGLLGCQLIRESGGQIVVQDQATSVVWGMPGSVANAGYADKVVALDQIRLEIVQRVREHRAALPA